MTDEHRIELDRLTKAQDLARSPWTHLNDEKGRAEAGNAVLRVILIVLACAIALGLFVTLAKAARVVPFEIHQAEGMQ